MKPLETLNLTKDDVNQLRFALCNLNTPSQAEARRIVEEWKLKLLYASRWMNPQHAHTVNVN